MHVAELKAQIISLRYENKLLTVEHNSLLAELDVFKVKNPDLLTELEAELELIEEKLGVKKKQRTQDIIKNISRSDFFEAEVQTLYRKLIKQVHPDISKNINTAKLAQQVTSAYSNANLAELLKLEQEINNNNQPLLMLRKEISDILNANNLLKTEILALKSSAAHLLKCKFEHLENLKQLAVAEAKAALRKKISAARHEFVSKKLSTLASSA
jgi:hypothetical protein